MWYIISIFHYKTVGLVFFTLLTGGGIVATDQLWFNASKCSFTMHIRFCKQSLIGANVKQSRLNLAWIDLAPFLPKRPKPKILHTCIVQ